LAYIRIFSILFSPVGCFLVHIAVLFISMLLFFVLFFGIGFILNMLLRMTWIMSILYPLVVLIIVDGISTLSYITHTREAFTTLGERLIGLKPADMLILLSGLAGAVLSGIVIKELRKKGYRMF